MDELIRNKCYNNTFETFRINQFIIQRGLKDRYLWITFLSALLICLLFFGKIMRSPDDYLFSTGGDGLQTYYQSIYHVKYDSTYLHQQGLNYPFGESIFFTGGQPLVTNLIKLLKPVVDLSDHVVGITNLMMLFGVLICPVFLYLIFRELGLKTVSRIVFALGITFLTQQWERFGGHYPLAFLYAIPGMIWMLMRFYATYSLKWTFYITAYMLFLVFAHLYYIVFFGVIAFSFWIVHVILSKHRSGSVIKSSLFAAVQLLVPFIVLQVFVSLSSDVSDRTSIPWGFLVYRSSWGGYLFPYGMWYESFFSFFKPKSGVEWEGLAYLGGSVIIMLISLTGMIVWKRRNFYQPFQKSENRIYLSLLIGAILCIAVSFAFPFNYGLENLLYKLGSIQQFRGIGRFAFVAFYLIQILAIGLFFRFFKEKNMLTIALTAAFGLLMITECKTRIQNIQNGIHHERGELLRNIKPLHATFDAAEYQAILPFPFFHIGSENIGADCDPSFKNHIYDISIRTGLPTFAASMSRTSIGQSFKNLALSQELMERPELAYTLPEEKAILVVCDTSTMSDHQKLITHHCQFLFHDGGFQYFKLILDESVVMDNAFSWAYNTNFWKVQDIDQSHWHNQEESEIWMSKDSCFALSDNAIDKITFGEGWVNWKKVAVDSTWRGKELKITFWVKDFKRDLIPRSILEIVEKTGQEVSGYHTEFIGKRFIGMKNNEALIEFVIPVSATTNSLELSFENKLLQGNTIECRDILICPNDVDCLILRGEKRFLNNRDYN